ncbi:MAG: hypothetical protein WBA16_05155 [Nonlabens sp.]
MSRQLLIVGSAIVVIGVGLYMMQVAGAIGLILLGLVTEALALFYYYRNKKSQ